MYRYIDQINIFVAEVETSFRLHEMTLPVSSCLQTHVIAALVKWVQAKDIWLV